MSNAPRRSILARIRPRAVWLESFLKSYRDAGAGEVPIARDRLRRSLELAAGDAIPDAEIEMWIEQLAIDPMARGYDWPAEPDTAKRADFLVAVIGTGMAGLNAAVHLKRAGIPFVAIEKNGEVGGTWHENRYPGARVDTPSRAYTHIFGVDFGYPNPFCEWRVPDDSVYTLDHLYSKLLTLEGTMQTSSGKLEARQRTEFLRTFLHQLQQEIG